MKPDRFDQLSKRFATRQSRRRALQQLGAAGVAATMLGLRGESAAADCPDIGYCIGPCGPSYVCTPPRFPLPGGPVGACWSFPTCNPCHTTWEALNAKCNQANPQCRGECYATFPY
jgi:hypothetical protein